MVHVPPLHTPLALAAAQLFPQLPQFAGSESKPVTAYSHPSPGRPLQSEKPAAQLPMVHTPEAHTPAPLSGSQASRHPPQLPRSD
jgi:hypothetical protein